MPTPARPSHAVPSEPVPSQSVPSRVTPIRHTVVFRLVHPAGSAEEADFLDAGRTTLAGIPGVDGFTVSRQISPKSDLGWQFSMTFADQDAYAGYNDHPAHVGFVADRWQHEVDSFQEYDFVPR